MTSVSQLGYLGLNVSNLAEWERFATELLGLLDSRHPGQLSPLLRAERELTRARLAALGGSQATAEYAAAVRSLREHGTPYHLAHGLLDNAEHLANAGDPQAAAQAIAEASDIAGGLRCQPLLDRAASLTASAAPSVPV